MNILLLLAGGLILYYLAYRYYGHYMSRMFGENDQNITPAYELHDQKDFVPTPSGVVFSHHFASIAGAGPIIGPTTALLPQFPPNYNMLGGSTLKHS